MSHWTTDVCSWGEWKAGRVGERTVGDALSQLGEMLNQEGSAFPNISEHTYWISVQTPSLKAQRGGQKTNSLCKMWANMGSALRVSIMEPL